MSGSFGAQVVLDPASPAALGARGGAASTIHGNTVARDLALISNGLDPLLTAGPPNAVVPFSLNFMRPGWLDPGVTFTRASTGTYVDASGVIQTAAINAPRWDYANGVLRGLLIEEARTNLFLNSATLVTQGVTVTATAYTLSFYGTGTVTKSGAATGALVGTGAGQRVTQTFTPTAGTVTCTVSGSVLNAQIEAGSFATSWISTAGATATRAQDVCTISPANMSPWFVSPGGTWFAEFIQQTPIAGGTPRVLAHPTVPASLTPMYVGSSGQVGQYDGVSAVDSLTFTATNAVSKGVTAWVAGAARSCANGGAVASSVALTTGYGALASVGVGILSGASIAESMTGYIRRVQYWPRALSAAEMQQVTT
jgi:hypothetical protein